MHYIILCALGTYYCYLFRRCVSHVSIVNHYKVIQILHVCFCCCRYLNVFGVNDCATDLTVSTLFGYIIIRGCETANE